MEFPMAIQTDGEKEAEVGNAYPHIRVFSVGKGTTSKIPLPDLQSVEQPWSVAGKDTLYQPTKEWSYFSAVCWFFGKHVSDGLDNKVPIGLISNNWGGTKVELWQPKGELFNAMIHPYFVGPMSLTGFAWYQGEANAGSQASADEYAQHFPTMIEEWRIGFRSPEAYFGFILLSTWCLNKNPVSAAELRQAQLKALDLPGKIGYASNADHGAGCNVHPPDKRYCAARLGNSALALQYGQPVAWRSPTYSRASLNWETVQHEGGTSSIPQVTIEFNDVSDQGLYLLENPYNNRLDPSNFNCAAQLEGTCAWPMVLLNDDRGWVNATLKLENNGQTVTMEPSSSSSSNTRSVLRSWQRHGSLDQDDATILATSYGWGSVPMLSLYDRATDLPVLGWHEKL